MKNSFGYFSKFYYINNIGVVRFFYLMLIFIGAVSFGSKVSLTSPIQSELPFYFGKIQMRKVYTKYCECGCGRLVKHPERGCRFICGHGATGRKKLPFVEKYCECGCGKLLPNANKGQRFISGHSRRGTKHSEITLEKMSLLKQGKNNPMYGRHYNHTEESKRKISIARTGMKFSEEHCKNIGLSKKGQVPWIKGRKHDEKTVIKMKKSSPKKRPWRLGLSPTKETCIKISNTLKGNIPWNKGLKGCYSEETLKNMSDSQIAWLKSNLNRFKDTTIEIAIEKQLQEKEISYLKQFFIKNVGIVDFFLPDYNIIIECDGDYWHNLERVRKKDSNRDFASMFCYQYKTIRFWEHEIKKSPANCMKRIDKFIKNKEV